MSTLYCVPLNFNPKPYHHTLSRTCVRSSLSCNSNGNTSSYEREEARWLREEQRWLREEQRWLKEESMWHAQRESLVRENFALKLQIQGGLVLEAAVEKERGMQASLGVPERGIMTAIISENLYTEHQVEYSRVVLKEDPKVNAIPKGANGAATLSLTEISQIQHKAVEYKGGAEIDATQNRVFLLGENRWEEPSRLINRNRATTNCISCRGEGRIICSECDGSGEPNIEPQFLEWGDEGMKCPYCKGIGFATCDVCDGKGEPAV